MLYDKEFLLKLDKQKNKAIYARITALTFQETPVEYIEGRVTQGSINLDGASAVRRSCSLTIVAQDFNYNDYYWGLNTKFKLEIGVENTVDSNYPDIIWFKQGIYLITSFNTSRNTNSFNISIQGKDKMCLLNGEVSGSLESSVDFGTIEEEDRNGNWVIRKLPIIDIIRNAVHTYGGEPYHNIIINDIENFGLELLEYRLNTPLYLYRNLNSPVYINSLLGGGNELYQVYPVKDGEVDMKGGPLATNLLKEFSNSDSEDYHPEYFEALIDSLIADNQSYAFIQSDDTEKIPYYFTKIEYGQTVGYRLTDLVYAGDLIANVGESLTSVLDKIKNMLSEFEYFYNLDGQFVFQKKQSVKETFFAFGEDKPMRTIVENNHRAYEFYNGELITAFNNNPNLLNLRNDYSIWGERTSASGAKIPIHLRYAIDKKPFRYTQVSVEDNNPQIIAYNSKYNTKLKGQVNPKTFTVDGSDGDEAFDWREILYQMALDYYKYNILDDFELRVAAANPIDYPRGRTGYEQYYIDIQGFWRQLYYPSAQSDYETAYSDCLEIEASVTNLTKELYGETVDGYEQTVGGIENDLKKLQELVDKELYKDQDLLDIINRYPFKDDEGNPIENNPHLSLKLLNDLYYRKKSELETLNLKYEELKTKVENLKQDYEDNYYIVPKEGEDLGDKLYWNRTVFEAPDQLNFWFDFLDTQGELQQFNVQTIGSRSKSINDTAIKSIYFRETPSVIFKEKDDETPITPGYRVIQAGGIQDMFTCSAQGKSAKNKLDELIYQHGYCVESATITTIPIYYLEPNTRIYIHDNETGLDGDYITSKITIPLTYNGTMSITATKAAETII